MAGSSKTGSVCSDEIDDKVSDDMESNDVITKEMIQEEEKLRIHADKEIEKMRMKFEVELYKFLCSNMFFLISDICPDDLMCVCVFAH